MINFLHHDAIDHHYIRHDPATTTLDAILCHMHTYSVQSINGWQMRSNAKFTPIKEDTIVELRPNPLVGRIMKEHNLMEKDDPQRLTIYHKFHAINPNTVASILFGHLNMDNTNVQPKQYLLGIVRETEWTGTDMIPH